MSANHRQVWGQSFYFFFYAAGAALVPYLPIYYLDLDLSGSQIGLLVGLQPLIMLIGAPLWSALADYTRRHKFVFSLAVGGTIGAVLIISQVSTFHWLIPIIFLQALFNAPIIPIIDNAVMGLLAGRKEQYGRVRLWGAAGWGLSAPLVGVLVERSGIYWIFPLFACLLFVAMLAGRRLPLNQGEAGAPFRQGVRTLFANRRWLLFLALVFVGGMSMSAINNFLFLYLAELGASASLMGISLTVGTLSEMPVFFFTDRMLRRWGARGLLVFAMLIYALRLFALSRVNQPIAVIVLQLLHGLTFSAMWVAGVSYANQIAPPGLGATAQGLFSGTKVGVGAAAGAFLCGWLFQEIGLAAMYFWMGVLALVSLLLFLVIERLLRNNQT